MANGDGKERPLARHDGFTPARRRACLEGLERFGTVTAACKAAGISRETFRRHRNASPDFRSACEAALARASGAVEAIAWERATVGAEEVTMRDGAVVQVKRKPSDAMLRMLLMASNPEKYGSLANARREAIEAAMRPRIEAELRAEAKSKEDRNSAESVALRAKIEAELTVIRARLLRRGAVPFDEAGPGT